jgi:hypothetical protein
LLGVQPKVFDQVQFLDADFGGGNIQQGKCAASKSAVLSLPTLPTGRQAAGRFVTFFAQAKKVKQDASRQKRT